MFGFSRPGRWQGFLLFAKMLAASLARMERERGCRVIDLDRTPHWLHRDLGLSDGRATDREMRRPPKWPDADAR